MFSIGRWNNKLHPAITFKVSDVAYEVLQHEPGLRPAPYFASRGMKWIQNYMVSGLSDEDLRSYLSQSHRIVSSSLSKKKKQELVEAFKAQ